MDARQARSRAALASAVLHLATERSADRLTASEIATRAGVHRSTFYEHAASPIELLQSVLREELDRLRDQYLLDVPPEGVADAVAAVSEAVLVHVEDYAVIYRRGLGEGSGSASLHAMLSSQFQSSLRLLLAHGAMALPFSIAGIEGAALERTVTTFIADGVVGAIGVWLTLPEPRDPAQFVEVLGQLVPGWLPISGNAGGGLAL